MPWAIPHRWPTSTFGGSWSGTGCSIPRPKATPGVDNALVQLTTEAFEADPGEQRRQQLNEFHALTVAVGKTHCGTTARCAECPLAADLVVAGVDPEHPANRP